MAEEIVIAEALNGQVRIHAADTTELIRTAREKHDLWPTSCAALGRVLTVDALMASDLKNADEHVTVTINGHGPAGTIVAQGNGRGGVRGFIGNPRLNMTNPETHKLDVGRAVGRDGTLTVTRDMGLKEPFTGVVQLQSGEIGEDFAVYFAYSEQTPSVVAVGVYVNPDATVEVAGGMIIQLMPDAVEDTIRYVELVSQTMRPMTDYLRAGRTPEQIIIELFPDAAVLEHKDTYWYCDCSRDHFLRALSLVDPHDIQEMIDEDHGAEVVCQYCGKKYQFSEEDLKTALEKRKNVEDRQRIDS
ncbi:MAG: Hsp33 family molecular chaperone HslO [Solobacterium sp.]|nr:Hsp33 family molecular chaperone HslO [Solobacterium sp.]